MRKISSFITLEKAKKIISRYIKYGTETIDTQNSLGRCLAQDISAPEDFPAFARSLYDGYAVNSKKNNEVRVQAFEPLRISTGQILPVSADSIVMLEDTKKIGNKITFNSKIQPGQNVILAGEDFKKGEFIFNKGFRLRPQDIGLLKGLGVKKIRAYKKLSVGIVSSGNELAASDEDPGYGQVRDMNSAMLSALVTQAGGEPVLLGVCPDNKEEIIKFIKKLNKIKIDLILFTGGTSVGNSDILEDVLLSLNGSKLLFHGLNIKPGKPALAGFWKGRLIIGLPGRPSSAFVVFHLLVKPVLCYSGDPITTLEVVLEESISSDPGMENYVPVLIEQRNGTLYAWPMNTKPSLFFPFVFFQGAIKIPIGNKIIKKGRPAEAILWNDL